MRKLPGGFNAVRSFQYIITSTAKLPKYPYGRYTGHRYEAMELESYSETLGKQSHIDKL